jgi:hypothetical protein
MDARNKKKLSLFGTITYQIKVPGHMDDHWFEWGEELIITQGCDEDGQPVTKLIGQLDQAALQGLLRRLYSFGLPLISVQYLEN